MKHIDSNVLEQMNQVKEKAWWDMKVQFGQYRWEETCNGYLSKGGWNIETVSFVSFKNFGDTVIVTVEQQIYGFYVVRLRENREQDFKEIHVSVCSKSDFDDMEYRLERRLHNCAIIREEANQYKADFVLDVLFRDSLHYLKWALEPLL